MAFPTITAHTGCEQTVDNTLESALTGIESGADFIEVDIRTTRDGIAVLSHDDLVPSKNGLYISISKSFASELENCRPKVQRLEPVFEKIIGSGKCINVDLKDDRSVEQVAVLLSRRPVFGQVVITGCGKKRAARLVQKNSRIKVFLNTNVSFLVRLPFIGTFAATALCKKAQRAGCCGLNINYKYTSRTLVEIAHKHQLLVSVWTVGKNDGFPFYIESGVDNITTKDVSALVLLRSTMQQTPRP